MKAAPLHRNERILKKLSDTVQALVKNHPGRTVEVWAEDECRIGLQSVARRVWALKGHRPCCDHRTRYQWLYAYGFVHPADGRSSWLLLPSVNADLMSLALSTFAKEADPRGDKILLLLIDRAGFHIAERLRVQTTFCSSRSRPTRRNSSLPSAHGRCSRSPSPIGA